MKDQFEDNAEAIRGDLEDIAEIARSAQQAFDESEATEMIQLSDAEKAKQAKIKADVRALADKVRGIIADAKPI
jgi:DnaJ-domain-containing protein 1